MIEPGGLESDAPIECRVLGMRVKANYQNAAMDHSNATAVIQNVAGLMGGYNFLSSDEARSFPGDLINRLCQAKAFGLCAKVEHGGAALSFADANRVISTAASFDASAASALVIHNFLAVPCIEKAHGLSDRPRILQEIASGQALCAFGLTEEGAGSAPRHISTFARRCDDGFLITGKKIWIGLGAWTEFVVCFARVPDDGNRIAAFLVDTKAEGFSVGAEHRTMGLRGIVQNTLCFRNVKVSADRCLSGSGDGFRLAKESMNRGRLGVAAMSVGVARRATQIVAMYASQRRMGNRILLDNDHIQRQVRDMIQSVESMDAVLRCAERQAVVTPLSEYLAVAAKVICSEWAHRIVDRSVQFFGGRGYEEDLVVARIYRDVRIMRIFEGPTETLLSYLDRSFASRATADEMGQAFTELGQKVLFDALRTAFGLGRKQKAADAVQRGWLVAYAIALAAHRAQNDNSARAHRIEEYLSERVSALVLEMNTRPVSYTPFSTDGLVGEFLESAGISIQTPEFDDGFMTLKNFRTAM
jgi:alkylation response protein AidB-like acyl-CoA dehydrogenase